MKKIGNILLTLLLGVGIVLTVWSGNKMVSYFAGEMWPFHQPPEYLYMRHSIGVFMILTASVIGMLKAFAKSTRKKVDRRNRKKSTVLMEEFRSLYPIDYTRFVGKTDIKTFIEAIEHHIQNVFTIENERKYRILPDGTSSGWEKQKERLEKLLTILDEHTEIERYINVAFQHFVQERWNECSINLRKMIEWMILTKIDAEETLFAGEQLPTMIELIKMYYNENALDRYKGVITADHMIKIHKNGNKAAHTFVSSEDAVDLNTCCSDFQRMESVILYYFEDEKVRHYLKTPLKDVKVYFELIDTLIIDEYYEDVAVNIRKSLELLVRSYFTKYQVRCLEDYQRDLCGYIDLLYFKNYISEESKSNMHKLRTITNEGAHMKTTKTHIDKENMLKCFEILKNEVEIYENMRSCQ